MLDRGRLARELLRPRELEQQRRSRPALATLLQSAGQVGGSAVRRAELHSVDRRAAQSGDRLRRTGRVAEQQMPRDRVELGALGGQQLRDPAMGRGALAWREVLIDRGADDRMGELEPSARGHHIRRDQRVERRKCLALSEPCQPARPGQSGVSAEHRDRLRHLNGMPREATEPAERRSRDRPRAGRP